MTRNPNHLLIYLSLVVTTLYFSLIQSFVTPLMPHFMRQFGVDQSAITWLISGYLLTAAIATPLIGKLGDIYGKARMFRVTMVIFTVGGLIAALADSYLMMLIARMTQGIGGAMFPLAFGIIRDNFSAKRVPGAIGQLSSTLSVGSGIGIVMVGPALDAFGYNTLFWGAVAVGLIATTMSFFLIPLSPRVRGASVDWAGALLLAVWLCLILIGVTQGNSLGWASAPVLLMLGAGLLLLVIWVYYQTRVKAPLISMKTMRNTTVFWGNVVAFLFGIVMFASGVFVTSFLQVSADTGYGIGATVTQAGLYMLPQTLVMFIVGVLSGWVVRVFTPRGAVLWGSLITTAGFTGMIFINAAAVEVILWSCVTSVGISLIFSQITNVILDAVPASETGSITGMNNNIRNIGGSVGAQVCAAVVVSFTVLGQPQLIGYQIVFLLFAAFSALAFAAALIIPKPSTQPA